MSIHTSYDEIRDDLRNKLTECLEIARNLLDETIWGYEEMKKDYATDVYVAVKKARDEI